MRLVTLLLALFTFLLFAPAANAAPPPKTAAQTTLSQKPAPKSPNRPAPSSKTAPRRDAKRQEEDEKPEDEEAEDEDPEEEPASEEEPVDDEDDDDEEAPAAEDEDDDDQKEEKKSASAARESYFEGLWNGVTGRRNQKAANLEAENAALKRRVATLKKKNHRQAKQLAHFDENWDTIEAALTQGDAENPALQTDLGKKVKVTVMKTAAQQMQKSGHSAKQLPGPKADKPPGGGSDRKPTAAELITLGMQQHRQRADQN